MLVPTTCFNCEAACGLVAYVDKETQRDPRSSRATRTTPARAGATAPRGRRPRTRSRIPERILYPLKRVGPRGVGRFERTTLGRGARRVRGEDPRGARRRAPRPRSCTTSAGPGTTATWTACCRAGASTATTATPTCARRRRGSATRCGRGADRPSPDHANAKFILLLSRAPGDRALLQPARAAHHRRARSKGAKLAVIDVRLSNTASMADYWLAPWPGTEAMLLLAMAHVLLREDLFDREFLETWVNWRGYLAALHPDDAPTFDALRRAADASATRASRRRRPRRSAASPQRDDRRASRARSARPGSALRDARVAQRGVGQPRRLAGRALPRVPVRARRRRRHARAARTSTRRTSSCRRRSCKPPPQKVWNELLYPPEWPLAHHELSLPAAALPARGPRQDRRLLHARLQPGLDQPRRADVGAGAARRVQDRAARRAHADLERDRAVRRLRAADGPRRRAPRPDEPGDARRAAGSASASPCCASRASAWASTSSGPGRRTRARSGRRTSSGSRCRGASTPTARSASASTTSRPTARASRSRIDEYYRWIFENSVPGLPEEAAKRGPDAARVHAPLRRVPGRGGHLARARARARGCGARGRRDEARTAPCARRASRSASWSTATPRAGFTTPSRRLELYSATMAEWGWPEHALPGLHREPRAPQDTSTRRSGEYVLVPTFRLPTLIHTRSGNAKWLYELSNTNPVWIHPEDAARIGVATRDLVRVSTRIGHFVNKVWVTEGMRPGVVACSHHLGRWRLFEDAGRQTLGQRARRARGARARPLPLPPRRGHPALRERRSRQQAHLVDRRRRAPEPHVPRAARSRLGHALLAPARDGRARAGRATATATSSSTRRSRWRSTASGSRWRARRRVPGDCGARCTSPAPCGRRTRRIGSERDGAV